MLQNICKFRESWFCESRSLLKSINEILPSFQVFYSVNRNVTSGVHADLLSGCELCENECTESCTSHIYCPVCVKFSIALCSTA
jgi:hypothetical protein